MRDIQESEKLPKKHYEVLGRIFVAFQDLEEVVMYSLANLTRPKNHLEFEVRYFLILNELPFRNRVKLLRNFLNNTDPEYFINIGGPNEEKHRKAIPQLISWLSDALVECCKIEDLRNQMVHSTWSPVLEGAKELARRYKIRVQPKTLSVADEVVTDKQLEELLEQVYEAISTISNTSWLLISSMVEKRENEL